MNKKGFVFYIALFLSVLSATAAYHVEREIGREKIKQIEQIIIGPNDTICVLSVTGHLILFNSDGSVFSEFDTKMKNTHAMAMGSEDQIYIFDTLTETKKVKVGARMRKVEIPIGVECGVFDTTGKRIRTFKLGKLKSAKTALFIGDSLVIADLTEKALVFMDAETGAETCRVKEGLRLCCGIFDICEAPNQTVGVANLGAFKLQQYQLDGKMLSEFGKRGRKLDDFQGCCNPVSAGYLPDGRIVTVEKDPTRIKIYDAQGQNAVKIEGVVNLVKGCSFIPMAIDRKGNIYLGANTHGYVVKCAP